MSWTRRIPRRLDFGFQHASIDIENCAPDWSLALPTSRPGSRLHGHGELVVTDIPERGVFVVDSMDHPGADLAGWRLLDAELETTDRGPATLLPLVDRERRRLFEVDPSTLEPPVFIHGGYDNEVGVELLSEGWMLVGEYTSNGKGGFNATTSMFSREPGGRVTCHWTVPSALIPSFPVGDDRLLAKRDRAPYDLFCLDVESGTELWSLPASGGPFSILGHDGTTAWLSARHALVGLELSSGEITTRVEVPEQSSPGGFIDDEGILHAFNGQTYVGFDLCSGGARKVSQRLKSEGRPRGGGAHFLNADGSLLATDEENRLFVIRIGKTVEATFLWQARRIISSMQAVSNGLLIIEDGTTLTAIR